VISTLVKYAGEFNYERKKFNSTGPSNEINNGASFQLHDTYYNDIQHNDIQHNDIQHNDIQHNDTQHNDIQGLILSVLYASYKPLRPRTFMLNVIILSVVYPGCH
jgi:hypothetical protein